MYIWRILYLVIEHVSYHQRDDNPPKKDRTGQFTIHPELLDEEGNITDEDLLTVRFSNDLDPPKQTESSSE